MKTLQSNFTTPEQSKRLLELGVPRFSADCYYGYYTRQSFMKVMVIDNGGTQYKVITRNDIIPCWSVGRLIEIIMLCGISANHKVEPILDSDLYEIHDTLIEYLVQELEEYDDWYDFSKLED